MSMNEMKNPKRWPPDRTLAKNGFVKRLYDRILGQKDYVVKRMANGKAVFGARKPTALSGDKHKLNDEVLLLQGTAIGLYQSFDCLIYVVIVDDKCVCAEAQKEGKHYWSTVSDDLVGLLLELYELFPRTMAARYNPESDPDKMALDDLEKLLARKRAEYLEKIEPRLPRAEVSAEEIAAASDPKEIERARKEAEKSMKTASGKE